MKKSKVIWFENPSEREVLNKIKRLEGEGWEVKEHGITSERNNFGEIKLYVSIL